MTPSTSTSNVAPARLYDRAILQQVFDLWREGKFNEANAVLTALDEVVRAQKKRPFTVTDVVFVDGSRTWKTKSESRLSVNIGIPRAVSLLTFEACDPQELQAIADSGAGDIRGTRNYVVNHIYPGQVGGTEFHRVREEIVTCTNGLLKWQVEDLAGGKLEFKLGPGQSVWMPPYIMHTYEALAANTCLSVLCNTTFTPGDKRTYDTYDHEEWGNLKLPITPSS